MGSPEPQRTENPFTDVKESDYYYKPVLWAVEQGITTGTSADAFSPAVTCTYAHMLTFLYRALGETKTWLDYGSGFNVDEWYANGYNWGIFEQIIPGGASGSYNAIPGEPYYAVPPNDLCARMDVVYFLWRALNR